MMRILALTLLVSVLACSGNRYRLMESEQTGIYFENRITENDSMNAANYEYIYNGAGVGIADLNNDGFADIILAGNQVSTKIYLNLGDFRFTDVTSKFKGLSNNQWYSGVTVTDINSDGRMDVYLSSTASSDPTRRKNRLWINQSTEDKLIFTEMAEQYGIADTCHSVAAGFLDYDRDGDLDLYILNNTLNSRSEAFFRPKITNGSAPNNDRLYRNNGDGTFTDVTLQAGITYEGFGLGMAVSDLNKDGYPDLYIDNDFSTNDLLYINQKNGTFRNEISRYISYQSKASMGNDIADINNDGLPDIYTLDMMPDSYSKRKQVNGGFSYLSYIYEDRYGYERQYVRNMLHVHNGFINGELIPFSEAGQIAGISQTNWSWSPLFADYDNDGDKDLMITTGYPMDLTDKDWTLHKVKMADIVSGEREILRMAPPIKAPDKIYENRGNLRFTERTGDWFPDDPAFSNGAAFADLDNDGDLDYIVNRINSKAGIYRNYSVERSPKKSNFIRVKLKGIASNTLGIGAIVEIWHGDRYQFTEQYLTRGYASSVDPVIHFGVNRSEIIDSARVTWPTGFVSLIKNIEANRLIEIDENDSRPPLPVHPASESLFETYEFPPDYIHQQTDFPDFFLNQKTIPHKFSQIGPVLGKGDLDCDGRDDILTGSTGLFPVTLFLYKNGRFEKASRTGLTEEKNSIHSDIAIADMNKDGLNDVIMVAGGYGNQEADNFRHFLYSNRKEKFEKLHLPVPGFPASVVKICDFNHDKFPDVFIGARVKIGMFPYAESSWLIINREGRLTREYSYAYDLGMVTDAVWSDYNNDGWEDLVVCREWNSVIILKNTGNGSLEPIEVSDIIEKKGIWYSIASGDFDNNGYNDFILGNMGENNQFSASESYPLNLYAIDFDRDGNIDPVVSGYWLDEKNRMREYPVSYLDELTAQSTYFQKKFSSYKNFSVATMNDLIGGNISESIKAKFPVNTLSSYILWNNKGQFTWEKLPYQAQLSPITEFLIRDLNQDGCPDIILAGNDYSWDVSTGYQDACKGIVLLSKGTKHEFEVLEPAQSGLLFNGMAGSILFLDSDSLIVVAGINRSKTVAFRLNE